MQRFWHHLRSDDRGATAIEYCLITAIVGISILLSAKFLGDETLDMWFMLASTVTAT